MVGSDKRLAWHPKHENRFLVGGGASITLYECPDSEIRHVTALHDLQLMKCFAWSPDPSFDDLIAVGNTTGSVDLIRLEAAKYARQNNVLTNGPKVPFTVRQSRACNALAFSGFDPNYLAVGLDKVRGDCSLVIWDVNTALPTLALRPIGDGTSPVTLIPKLPRPQPPIPRAGDTGRSTDSRIVQQHAPADTVSALAFLPKSPHQLLAGISNRWLRLFDLRSAVPSTTSAPSKVQGIATDPFDTHRIACYGDGFVTVYDSRKLPQPIMMFSERDAAADGAVLRLNSVFTNIEFSSTRRGTLATLERDATYVRFWDILEGQARRLDVSESDKSKEPATAPLPRLSWANLPWGASGNTQTQAISTSKDESVASLILADTRKTKIFHRPLSSFALTPRRTSKSLTSHVMVVNREGDLELYAVHDTPEQAVWSARGDLAIGAGQSYQTLAVKLDNDDANREPWDIQNQGNSGKTRSRSNHGKNELDLQLDPLTSPPLFGRGDAEGFPTLSSPANAQQTNLSATRPRRHSSSILQNTGHDRTRSRSRAKNDGDEAALTVQRGRKPLATRNSGFLKGITAIEDDISMVMRRRTLRGYGLSDPHHNLAVIEAEDAQSEIAKQVLSELWAWVHHSREFLCVPTSKVHGYDFAYEGLIGIWEGLQSSSPGIESNFLEPQPLSSKIRNSRRSRSPADDFHGNFHAALTSLTTRRGMDRSSWKPTVSTNRLIQRQVALQLCGWSFKEDEFMNEIKRWEKEGRFSRAACWLVFTRQYGKAIELLLRSNDEAHQMMSGTIAAVVSAHGSANSRNSELQRHCEHLIVKLQDPYFRAMLTHLTAGDWSDVLSEEVFPFRERLAIAFQFLDDKALTSYLRSCKGDIDSLIVTGLTKSGMDLLQTYVDKTGDVQTAAILTSYVNPWKVQDVRGEKWLESYRDLLDGFKLHNFRVIFDIECGKILQTAVHNGDIPPFQWVPNQILIRCNYCNKPVNGTGSLPIQPDSRPTSCPNCSRALPRCSVCLMTLKIVSVREAELVHSPKKDMFEDAIVICQTCRHGGHASHILDWFFGDDESRAHLTCAVADCDCQCANEF